MNKSQLRDVIDSEFKRVKIQNHPGYAEWYGSLRTYAKLVVENILEEDVSAEIISFAQDCPSDDLEDYEFLREIANASPVPSNMLGLTNITLEYLFSDLVEFYEQGYTE